MLCGFAWLALIMLWAHATYCYERVAVGVTRISRGIGLAPRLVTVIGQNCDQEQKAIALENGKFYDPFPNGCYMLDAVIASCQGRAGE